MSQVVQMTAAFTLAGLVFFDAIEIWHILTLSFLTGCAQAFGGPAYQTLVPTLVGKEHLPNAIALNSIQFNLARVIGPIVAGVALAAFGMVMCFGINGISFLFVIAAILALRNVHVPPAATTPLLDQMKDGLCYVRDSPNLKTLTIMGFIAAFLGLPLLTFLPIVARDVFQQDVGLYTRMMTMSGIGAVVGAMFVAWLGKHRHMGRILLILLVAFGLTMTAFALSREVWLSTTILFFTGALLVMSFSLTNSLVQLIAPAELRGRVVSIYMMAFRGGSPLGGLASGWLITQVGSAPAMLAVNGVVLAALAGYFLLRGHGIKDV
jgi:MFS family permease